MGAIVESRSDLVSLALLDPPTPSNAIIKKRLDLDASLYTLLLILSVTLFEKGHYIKYLTNSKPGPMLRK